MNTNPRYIYTDGAAPNNQNGCVLGGIGVAVLDKSGDVELTISQPVKPLPGCSYTTNSRCELLAFATGLELAEDGDTIFSDSKYVVDGYNDWLKNWAANGWRKAGKKKLEHADIWKRIHTLKSQYKSVCVRWVKAHSNIKGNLLADNLASSATT